MDSGPQQYSLHWNNYISHITGAFDALRSEGELIDCTICCEGRKIKAHKILLSACSVYFREILKDNPCSHPVIILNGISHTDLSTLIDFIYSGEVNVTEDRLGSFLSTAELLKVKGLTDVTGGGKNAQKLSRPSPTPPQDATTPRTTPTTPTLSNQIPSDPVKRRKINFTLPLENNYPSLNWVPVVRPFNNGPQLYCNNSCEYSASPMVKTECGKEDVGGDVTSGPQVKRRRSEDDVEVGKEERGKTDPDVCSESPASTSYSRQPQCNGGTVLANSSVSSSDSVLSNGIVKQESNTDPSLDLPTTCYYFSTSTSSSTYTCGTCRKVFKTQGEARLHVAPKTDTKFCYLCTSYIGKNDKETRRRYQQKHLDV